MDSNHEHSQQPFDMSGDFEDGMFANLDEAFQEYEHEQNLLPNPDQQIPNQHHDQVNDQDDVPNGQYCPSLGVDEIHQRRNGLDKANSSYGLPQDILDYFEDVRTGLDGEYVILTIVLP